MTEETEVQEEIQEKTEQTTAEPPKETPKYSREDYDKIQAAKARQSGWKDFDEFVAEGNDPAKWKTADAYNTYGELMGTIRRKEADFESRLQGVQRLSEAQLKAQREQLLAERDALIEEGGKTKEVKVIDQQLAAINQPQVPQSNALLDQWNADNPWILEDTPKAAYAKQVFGREVASGKTVAQAIAAVEAGIKQHYPPPARTGHVPESERGGGPKGFTRTPKSATMDSLTAEEAHIWKHSSAMWNNDEKAFLQSVTDSRKAAGGKS